MYEAEREELVEILQSKGIKDENVLRAIKKVERHKFVPETILFHAYLDKALPIGDNQTISQPYTVAFMTEALAIQKGDKVLEIGTGSGYQAAILLEMGCEVYSIERISNIYNRTLKLFDQMRLRAALRCSDGTIGWSDYAPYDKIIVTAAGPSVPNALKRQLKVGGKLVMPVGEKSSQSLVVLTKTGEDEFEAVSHPNFLFVPLIGHEGWEKK
ncbi:MAG: protein-L-isoaspartate(D-aspartate) O-methyltransferase [Chlorobi bacterium]|nr:protein-L-isoaspartate(D-aspartate) O-methyltransferase [Chlorobiota bacterium]